MDVGFIAVFIVNVSLAAPMDVGFIAVFIVNVSLPAPMDVGFIADPVKWCP
jgi:hypothetical protein